MPFPAGKEKAYIRRGIKCPEKPLAKKRGAKGIKRISGQRGKSL